MMHWLFDLGAFPGPWVVVGGDTEQQARERLARHLVDIGLAPDLATGVARLTEFEADMGVVVIS